VGGAFWTVATVTDVERMTGGIDHHTAHAVGVGQPTHMAYLLHAVVDVIDVHLTRLKDVLVVMRFRGAHRELRGSRPFTGYERRR
jgi:hypothetical protein